MPHSKPRRYKNLRATDATVDHIHELRSRGLSWRAVADATDLSPTYCRNLYLGRRRTCCHVDTEVEWIFSRLTITSKCWLYPQPYEYHRRMFELFRRPVPDGMYVLHHCDEPRCVRPSHMYLGDHEDNMRDTDDARFKLSDDQVRAMRDEYARGGVTQAELGRRYGVHQVTVSAIITGKIRKYV